jgi:uncharacterized membrane protein
MAQHSLKTTAAGSTPGRQALALIRRAPDAAVLVAMALGGIAISIYLTAVHYAGAPLVCSVGGIVNCTQVTTSAYSVVPATQVPVTIPGMLWFLVSGGLAIASWFALVRYGKVPARICLAQVAWGAAGLIAVLYLVYVEIVRLHAICEWCTVVHVLTLAIFLVAMYRMQQVPSSP